MNRWLLHPAVKPIVFLLALAPLASLFVGALMETLGANPAEALIRGTGEWALRLLWLTLAVTPLRLWFGWTALLRLRRMLGLFAFFYGLLHFTAYAWLDQGFALDDILRDIGKRPFILVGTAALLAMLPLAATSFHRAVRAMGGRRWQALHRLVYAVALLALLHFLWMRAGKQLFAEVTVYGVLLSVLLGARVHAWLQRAQRSNTSVGASRPREKDDPVAHG